MATAAEGETAGLTAGDGVAVARLVFDHGTPADATFLDEVRAIRTGFVVEMAKMVRGIRVAAWFRTLAGKAAGRWFRAAGYRGHYPRSAAVTSEFVEACF